jgi:hypothetical protein
VGAEVASLSARRGPGGLDQRAPEPLVAARGGDAAAFARRLVAARAQANPGGQIAGSREPGHVGAGLGDDHLDREPVEPGHRQKRRVHRRKRGRARIDLLGQGGDRLAQEVEMIEDPPAGDGVVGAEVSGQRLGQRRDLRAHLAHRQLGQLRAIALA